MFSQVNFVFCVVGNLGNVLAQLYEMPNSFLMQQKILKITNVSYLNLKSVHLNKECHNDI